MDMAVFELSKNRWGLKISRHAIDLNRYVRMYGGELKLTLQGILFGGLSKQLGGSTPNPPAFQTLGYRPIQFDGFCLKFFFFSVQLAAVCCTL
jgi:hypothetical protein